jgi:hypothetical protein
VTIAMLESIVLQPTSSLPAPLTTRLAVAHGVHSYGGVLAQPTDFDDWRHLVQATVQMAVDRFGLAEVQQWRFEVWNELWGMGDGPGSPACTTSPCIGTTYMKLYNASAIGVKAVRAPSASSCSCLSRVWLLSVSCLAPVCLVSVSCLSVSCLSPVCLVSVSCLAPVYLVSGSLSANADRAVIQDESAHNIFLSESFVCVPPPPTTTPPPPPPPPPPSPPPPPPHHPPTLAHPNRPCTLTH